MEFSKKLIRFAARLLGRLEQGYKVKDIRGYPQKKMFDVIVSMYSSVPYKSAANLINFLENLFINFGKFQAKAFIFINEK